jgi:hypothetical protein
MKNRILFMTILLASFNSNAQVEHANYSRLTETLGGMNRCEKADFDEYHFVESKTSFNRSTKLKAGQAADFDHEVEALMFSEGAGSSYRFSSCQRQLFEHLEKGLQDSGEYRSLALRRAAWLQFNYLRTQIQSTMKQADTARGQSATIRSGMAYGEPGERTMWAIQESMGMGSHRQKLQESQSKVASLDAHLRSLVSRIPLGNRPEMKEMLVKLAQTPGKISEKQFNAAFERQIIKLNAQALKSLQFWESNVHFLNNGKLAARVDNDLKIALIESGQMDMVVGASGMSQRSQNEFMCRSKARYVSGPRNRDGIISVASMIGGYGLARLAVRAGLKAATAASLAERSGARLVQVPALAAWIGLEGSALAVDLEYARRTCFRPEFLSGVNESQCSFESEFNGAFYEASAAECITSSILAAAPAAMSVMGVLSAVPKTIRSFDGSMITTNLPGINKMIDLPNGEGRITHYDTGIKLTERQGLRISEYPDSSSIKKVTEETGKFKETHYRDGRITRENADQTRVEIGNDGSKVSYDGQGRVISETPGKTIVVVGKRQVKEVTDEFEKMRALVGTRMDRPEVEAFVRDELKTIESFPAPEKKIAMDKLVGKVKNWDSVSNVKTKLLSKARQKRFERDVERFRKKILKSNADLDEASLLKMSQEAAAAKRARISELRGMCTTIRPNAANAKAGALFATYSGGLGAINAGVSFGAATWDSDMSRTTWGIRLGYEVVMSYLFNLWTARITAKPDSSFLARVTQQNVLAFLSNIVDAGIYQHFFNTKAEAHKELERIAASPTFVEDMNKLIDHVKNKSQMEKIVDGMGDISNNLVRMVSGNEQISDLSPEELKNLNQEALKDPIVQEQLLDLIDDKMLIDGGISTGNMGVDRLAYNTVYNLPSVPVNMAVGMFAFQAVCMNLDSPIKAMAAFGGITFTRQFSNGYIFFESREKVLGSN